MALWVCFMVFPSVPCVREPARSAWPDGFIEFKDQAFRLVCELADAADIDADIIQLKSAQLRAASMGSPCCRQAARRVPGYARQEPVRAGRRRRWRRG